MIFKVIQISLSNNLSKGNWMVSYILMNVYQSNNPNVLILPSQHQKRRIMSKVNIALQILPKSKTEDAYSLVDKAIQVIHDSGIKYKVCPFETVMEGEYDELMGIVKRVQDTCLEKGADEMMVYLKIQRNKDRDVSIEDKMEKYE